MSQMLEGQQQVFYSKLNLAILGKEAWFMKEPLDLVEAAFIFYKIQLLMSLCHRCQMPL